MFSEAIIPNPSRYRRPLASTASKTVFPRFRFSVEACQPPGFAVMEKWTAVRSLNPPNLMQ